MVVVFKSLMPPVLSMLLCLNAIAAQTAPTEGRGPGIDLASLNGWVIIVPEDAIESELYAAEEFRRYYAQASGNDLPVRTDPAGAAGQIYIGGGKAMRASPVGFNAAQYGQEDLRIVVGKSAIAIAGGRPRGTLYGVYTFLEDYLGVRFLTVDHTHVPPVGKSRPLAAGERFYHPPLNFRWVYYKVNFDHPDFAARLRINTLPGRHKQTWQFPGIPKLGGKTGVTLACHSFRYQIPPGKYAADHPEYYSLFKGKRLASLKPGDFPDYTFSGGYVYGMQPCLTHPEVLRIVTRSVLDECRAHPEITSVSVSQDDGGAFCQCPKCAALIQREGMSGYVLSFVNRVADAVAREYPGKLVSTLAYSDTFAPPRTIKPRPNVQVWFCTINTCFIHRLDDPQCRHSGTGGNNVAFSEYIARWDQICKNFYIWDYVNLTNYQLPFPNFRSIDHKFKYLVRHRVKGIFLQATGECYNNEFQDLRNYLAASLMWDPNRRGEEVMNEFLALHLGKSAEPIRTYIVHLMDKAEASGLYCRCVEGKWAEYGMDRSDAERGLAVFAQAMRLAPNDTVRTRVEKMSVVAYRAALEPVWYLKPEDKPSIDPELVRQMRPLARQYFELCGKYDVERTAEGSQWTVAAARQRLQVLLGDLGEGR